MQSDFCAFFPMDIKDRDMGLCLFIISFRSTKEVEHNAKNEVNNLHTWLKKLNYGMSVNARQGGHRWKYLAYWMDRVGRTFYWKVTKIDGMISCDCDTKHNL